MKVNKKRVIEVTWTDRLYLRLKLNGDTRPWCKSKIRDALGKNPKKGMKLALVDLAEYDVEGVNCD